MTKEASPIHCTATKKLLARRDEHGVWLWCKACRREHYVPFVSKDSTKQPGKAV